ncbi:Hypothetical predicted protein [Cloeon dipterum]|uniref:Uncharacterized protein n=1 Tax=Cloeon dipterum TaxID=197152 RepID=A0A8S1CTV7_9INSE|nr:Hypothetical predicted protein [Cloeon dipterum]
MSETECGPKCPNRPNEVDLAANRCTLFVKSCKVEDVRAPAEAGEKWIEALLDEPLAHFEIKFGSFSCTKRALSSLLYVTQCCIRRSLVAA